MEKHERKLGALSAIIDKIEALHGKSAAESVEARAEEIRDHLIFFESNQSETIQHSANLFFYNFRRLFRSASSPAEMLREVAEPVLEEYDKKTADVIRLAIIEYLNKLEHTKVPLVKILLTDDEQQSLLLEHYTAEYFEKLGVGLSTGLTPETAPA